MPLLTEKKTEFEHHADDTVGFLTPEQLNGSEFANVIVYQPWLAYKYWLAGRARTTDMLLSLADWCAGQCRIQAILGGKREAEKYRDLTYGLHDTWQWNESGSLDGYSLLTLLEPVLKEIRPEIKVQPVQTESYRLGFPPNNDRSCRVFHSKIEIEADGRSAKIVVCATRQGGKPGKTHRIWQVCRIAKREYYWGQVLIPAVPFSQELTMVEAVELGRRMAFDEA
jgi:hypothetical protein